MAAGVPADVVLFRWDGARIGVEQVYKEGGLVFAGAVPEPSGEAP
jgi:hypothetical protein